MKTIICAMTCSSQTDKVLREMANQKYNGVKEVRACSKDVYDDDCIILGGIIGSFLMRDDKEVLIITNPPTFLSHFLENMDEFNTSWDFHLYKIAFLPYELIRTQYYEFYDFFVDCRDMNDVPNQLEKIFSIEKGE
jgi:hypothetical protein